MTENVEPEEALAIRDLLHEGAAGSPCAVSGRDFRRPRRLSTKELTGVRERLLASLPDVEAVVARLLGGEVELELADLSEDSAESVLDGLGAPLAAARFAVAGQPAWVVWDVAPALGAVERIIGGASPQGAAPESRPLSPTELHVLGGLFAGLVDGVCRALDLDAEALTVLRDPGQAGGWRDGDPEHADPHRLCVSFALAGLPEGTLRIYLPGFLSSARRRGADAGVRELPAHLAPVRVRARVRLGTVEVPLSDLLALEEGDVIPLELRPDGLVDVDVEGQPSARGVLGTHHGRYAVRIQELSSAPSRPDEPR